MKLLITGVSGQLGGEIYKASHHENYGTYLSNLPSIDSERIKKVDIADFDGIFDFVQKIKPDCIIHSAALRNVDLCEENKELAWKSNVMGTKNTVDVCGKLGIKLVFISTDYVFDGTNGYYKEDDVPNPINFYALTKLVGEYLVRGLENHIIIRTSMLINNLPGNYVDFTIKGLERGGIDGATDIISSPTFVPELAEASIMAIEKDLVGTYHMAGDDRISRYDFMKVVADTFGYDNSLVKPTTSEELKFKARRPKDTSLDISKVKNQRIRFSTLKDSLKKLNA